MKTKIDYVSIGSRIKCLRKLQKMTQERFAEKCGIDTSTIQKIESGDRSMKIDTLVPICKQLGVSADYILFGETVTSAELSFKLTKDHLNTIDQNDFVMFNELFDAIIKDINIYNITNGNSK